MAIKILMPAVSEEMTEGVLVSWLVKPGDAVEIGDVIAEIETDKATVELEAEDAGVLGEILVAAGSEGIPVNHPIALLLERGEDGSELKEMPGDAAEKIAADTSIQVNLPDIPESDKPAQNRIFASPLARRMATEGSIDLESIPEGSGPQGRIVKIDIERTAASSDAVADKSPLASPAQSDQPFTELPGNSIRKVIAKRLTESKRDVPHFYLGIDCHIDRLLNLCKILNGREGADYKISVNDFIIRAVALALREVPLANSSWTGETIRLFNEVDISVAVAAPDGLITPIVRKADTKDLITISKEVKELAARARDGKLQPDEFQGGGFTISNLGMFGIREFSAIINPPQSCILAIGAGEKRPVVVEDKLAIATVMTCTLSVDHRSVDGVVGAEFLSAFKQFIEDPLTLPM